MNLLVTHNTINSPALEKKASELGVNILFQSLISTIPLPLSEKEITSFEELKAPTGVLFTSANGVEYFFDALEKISISLTHLRFFTSGEKTTAALVSKGVTPSASSVIGGEQGVRLIDAHNFNGLSTIVYVTSEKAENGIPEFIDEYGIECKRINIYTIEEEKTEVLLPICDMLCNNEIGTVFFTSPSSVKVYFNLIESEPKCNKERLLAVERVAAIGDVTGRALEQRGLTPLYVGKGRSLEYELLRCLETVA